LAVKNCETCELGRKLNGGLGKYVLWIVMTNRQEKNRKKMCQIIPSTFNNI
jgi:hypothetical protein